ncbi:MAG: hypothetical protein IPI77_23470 [Saprospiraceae bacterium]|nr:hypothetical protein [Saprospiraceae bacterium]
MGQGIFSPLGLTDRAGHVSDTWSTRCGDNISPGQCLAYTARRAVYRSQLNYVSYAFVIPDKYSRIFWVNKLLVQDGFGKIGDNRYPGLQMHGLWLFCGKG